MTDQLHADLQFRAIRRISQYGSLVWEIQQRTWYGWKRLMTEYNKADAQIMLDLVSAQAVIYPGESK